MSAELPGLPCPGPSVLVSPPQRMLPDLRRFQLTEDARYSWCRPGTVDQALCLVVPSGFHHDFASVPRVVWGLISPFDLGMASVFHDWIYRHGGRVETLRGPGREGSWEPVTTPWTRRDTDRLFARIMREQGVAKWRRRMAYRAVRLFGGGAWQRG